MIYKEFSIEVKGIMDESQRVQLKDPGVLNKGVQRTRLTSVDGEDTPITNPMGGGGTDFMAHWAYMKKSMIFRLKSL